VIGLGDGLKYDISPTTVDVILTGPLAVLNSLQPDDVHVLLDLSGLAAGTYQLIPAVTVVEQGVTVQSILPETVEVTVTKGTATTLATTPITMPAATPTP